MPRILEIAIQTAIAHRAVSVVAIPGDIALRHAVVQEPRLYFPPPKPTVCPSADEIETLAKVLNKSEKITILAGAGCAGAHAELIALAGKLNAPIVHALRGKEFIEYDNPFDVGMTDLLGFSSGYFAMMNCDTLLMIGTDFPYQQFFPEHAAIAQIDIRGEQFGRRTKLDYGLVGDTKATLKALLSKLEQNAEGKHLKQSVEHYRKARKTLDELATEGTEKKRSHPQFVARMISELASEDAIFTSDVGTPTIWVARYLKMNGKRAGNESDRFSRFRRGVKESRLCRAGRIRWLPRAYSGNTARCPTDVAKSIQTRCPGACRSSRASPGTFDAADHHAEGSDWLRPVHAQSGPKRTWRRTCRSGEG